MCIIKSIPFTLRKTLPWMIDDPSNPNGIVIKEGSSWLCFYPSRPSRAWGALSPSARKQILSKDSLQRIRPHSYGLACLALEARVTCAAFYWLTGHQPMTPNSFNRLSIKKKQQKKNQTCCEDTTHPQGLTCHSFIHGSNICSCSVLLPMVG